MVLVQLMVATLCFVATSSSATGLELEIDSVRTLGSWSHDGQLGTYRLIVRTRGYEHAHSELWLQWLAWEEESHGMSFARVLVAQRPIIEINRLQFQLDEPECADMGRCDSMTIKARSGFDSVPNKQFRIVPAQPGEYEVHEIEF